MKQNRSEMLSEKLEPVLSNSRSGIQWWRQTFWNRVLLIRPILGSGLFKFWEVRGHVQYHLSHIVFPSEYLTLQGRLFVNFVFSGQPFHDRVWNDAAVYRRGYPTRLGHAAQDGAGPEDQVTCLQRSDCTRRVGGTGSRGGPDGHEMSN